MGNYYAGIMNSEAGRELRHHGILGQKWGMRRFQNPDGSLTPAGRERYGYSSKKKTADEVAKNGMGRMSLKDLLTSIAYNAPRKEDSLSGREMRKLQSSMQDRDDMAQKYKMVTEAAEEMNKARKQVPPLKENSKTYKELRNRAIDKGADYYVREFGLSKDEARKWASEEEEILKDEIDRAYLNISQHPAAKAYREKRETYLDLYRELSNDVDKTIRTTLGSNLNFSQIGKATRAIYDAMIKKLKQQSSDIPKTGMNLNSISKRISNRYNGYTTGETDSTKVSDRILKQQMERNINRNTQLQKNWDFSGPSAREERNLSKKFVKTVVKEFDNGNKTLGDLWRNGDHEAYYKAAAERRNKAKRAANEYIREVAKIRLKSMGYDVTNKAIDNLISKDWFKNSLWIQNTLASLGADGVNHTPKDDMIFR